MQQQELINELAANSTEVLAWLKATVPQAKDFVIEQAPLLAKEIIAYSRVTSVTYLLLAWGGCLILLDQVRRAIKAIYNAPADGNDFHAVRLIFCLLMSVVLLVIGIVNVGPATKSVFAPRLTLIDYITDRCR